MTDTDGLTLNRMIKKKETPLAYEAFRDYCRLGENRSIADVVRLQGKPPTSQSQYETWSSRFSWVMRASMFDELRDPVQQSIALRDENVTAGDMLATLAQEPASKVYRLANRKLDAMLNNGGEVDADELIKVTRALTTIDKFLRTAMGIESKVETVEEEEATTYIIGGN